MTTTVSIEQKTRLLEQAKLISRLGLTPLTQGNLSLRDEKSNLVVITPHDYSYDMMKIEDLVVVDLNGKILEGTRKPSAETPVHLAVYRDKKNIFGIVHSEPILTNTFGVLGRPILPVFVNMAIDVRGAVPIMPFAASGSPEFGAEMLKVMGDKHAVIWANHGLLTIGETLEKAVHCTVMVEAAAEMYLNALQVGGELSIIPQDIINDLVG